MELLLQLTLKSGGVKTQWQVLISEDHVLTMTPERLWHYYTELSQRVENKHKEFKEKKQ